MSEEDLETFRRSMQIGYHEWHEGIGYDLGALRRLSVAERMQVEALVLAREARDWRDIEALDALGSERALKALEGALAVESLDVRMEALSRLVRRGLLGAADVEAHLLAALPETTLLNGMVKTFRLAEQYPTPALRRALLGLARRGHEDVRVHAAALVCFLAGKARSAFDLKRRPFYLRFGGHNPAADRDAAFMELCREVGVDPQSVD